MLENFNFEKYSHKKTLSITESKIENESMRNRFGEGINHKINIHDNKSEKKSKQPLFDFKDKFMFYNINF